MRNPFTTLGLSRIEAKALHDLPPRQRSGSLNLLRRYYGLLMHPDKTGKSSSMLAEINNSLDTLDNPQSFSEYYKQYLQLGPPSSTDATYIETLKKQAQWQKNRADKLERKVNSQVQKKEEQIATLQENITKLNRELSLAQEKTSNALRPKFQKLTATLKELRKDKYEQEKSLRTVIFRLLAQLAKDGSSTPEGALPLSQLADVRLERANSYFVVENGLYLLSGSGGKKPEKRLGRLLGGLTGEDMRSLLKKYKLAPGTKGYNDILLNIKPYLGPGMHPVTQWGNNILRTVARPILKVVPANAKTTTEPTI